MCPNQRRYRKELEANTAALEPLLEASKKQPVTLLYSARDVEHNGAIVLRDYLATHTRGKRKAPARRAQTRTH